MISPKSLLKNIAAALAIISGAITALPMLVSAQSNSGLTIFSGVERSNILNYHLDFGGRVGTWDRYRLRIPPKKLTEGASKFIIDYPDYYKGKFDVDKVEVRVGGESLPLREVYWDQENHFLEIALEEDLVESRKTEIVLSNVRNPKRVGTFYFNCQVVAAGPYPVRLYLGTWLVSIGVGRN